MNNSIKQIPDSKEAVNGFVPLWNIHETAQVLGCCAKSLAKLCDTRGLPFHWIGRKRMFRSEDIQEFWNGKRIDRPGSTRVDAALIMDGRNGNIMWGYK
jgi:hypothetical protein